MSTELRRGAVRNDVGRAWDAVESYADGIVAAIFLLAVYVLVFYLPRTPLRGPGWWAAGFGPVL